MKSSTRNPVVVGAVLVGILSGLGLLSRFLSYTKKPVPEDSAPPRNRRLSMRIDASANSLPVLRSLITNVLFSPSVDHGPRDTSLNSTKRQSVTSVSFNPR